MRARFVCLATALTLLVASPAAGQGHGGRSGQPERPVVVKVSRGGFRWGDAAVGAAAASGAALVLAGIAMFRRQLRKEEP